MSSSLNAGAACSEIQFPEGYFPSDGYAGLHDPLHCRVLILEQGAMRGGIVSMELPSIRPWSLTDGLRQFAAQCIDAPYENVWLVMTHDLAAPHVPPEEPKRTWHMEALRAAVKEAAAGALRSLCPVTLYYSESECDVNSNRNLESRDGWWVGISPTGPSRKTLSLLQFLDASGKPVAMLYSYAIKSSVLEEADMSDGRRYASSDVTGRANLKAEAVTGCPVLFVMGAAGDQVPRQKAHTLALDSSNRFYPVDLQEEGYAILESLSDELSRSILDAASNQSFQMPLPRLRFAHIAIPCSGKKPYPKSLPRPPVLSYAYEPDDDQPLDIWCIRLGSVSLLGVKPEIPTPIFDTLLERRPFTLLATLVNGGQGYIATDWDLEHFTYPGLNTPFQSGTDRLFIEQANELISSL